MDIQEPRIVVMTATILASQLWMDNLRKEHGFAILSTDARRETIYGADWSTLSGQDDHYNKEAALGGIIYCNRTPLLAENQAVIIGSTAPLSDQRSQLLYTKTQQRLSADYVLYS